MIRDQKLKCDMQRFPKPFSEFAFSSELDKPVYFFGGLSSEPAVLLSHLPSHDFWVADRTFSWLIQSFGQVDLTPDTPMESEV